MCDYTDGILADEIYFPGDRTKMGNRLSKG